MSQEESTRFYDQLNHHIFELVSSSDANERKGGILAIGKNRVSGDNIHWQQRTVHLCVHCTPYLLLIRSIFHICLLNFKELGGFLCTYLGINSSISPGV